MRINQNITAINSHNKVSIVNHKLAKGMEKLSSGMKVNRAGDDASGLAISEKMRSQIRGLNMATKNSQDGVSLIQTAEGALIEVHANLQRMRELAVQTANDTNTDDDRDKLQYEVDRLRQEIDNIARTTEFNTRILFTGDYEENPLYFQVGANENQIVPLKMSDMQANKLGITGYDEIKTKDEMGNEVIKKVPSETKGVSIYTSQEASAAITTFDKAIEKVSLERARFGAMQNRLEHTIKNLRVASENLSASESRIRDTDMAKEVVKLSKNKVISSATTAMLTQANSMPQAVVKLLS